MGSPWDYCHPVWYAKTSMVRLPGMGSLTTIPACDGRTNGQTSCHGIVRATHTRRGVKIIGFSWNFVHSSKFWTRRTSHDKKLLKSCIGQTPSSTERISCSLTKFVERIMSRMSIKSHWRQSPGGQLLWTPAQRSLSEVHVIFCECYFIYLFFYGRLMLRSRLTEVRETFTHGGPWVWIEKLLLGFFPGPP